MSLVDIVRQMEAVRFLVIGDAMTDRYVFGRVERVCPEAPVPVFIPERTEERPGGAANVLDQLREYRGKGLGLFGPTSLKTRYMVGHHLMLRCDEDMADFPSAAQVEQAVSELRAMTPLSVVVLSDYAKGWLSPLLCEQVINAALERNVPIVVDPKGTNWSKYRGATIVCPNEREADSRTDETWFAYRVFKRGARGIFVQEFNAGHTWDIPAKAQHVFDVTGAGDTVVATVAAAIAAGATVQDAAQLAVLASGYVVGEIGTTVCPHAKLLELAAAHDKGRQ